MNIESKILEYLQLRGENTYGVFPFLEQYLMARYKEREYIGAYLIQKVKDMEKDGLVKISNIKIFITPKGLEYLSNNTE